MMMRCSYFLVCLFLISASLFVYATFELSPAPVLLWSGKNYFSGQQHLDTISHLDVEKMFQSFLGVSNIQSSLNQYFPKQQEQEQIPEVVVVFIESKLGTNQLSQLNSEQSLSFKHLKDLFRSSTSSMSIPYVISSSLLSGSLINVASELKQHSPSSQIILIKASGSEAFEDLSISHIVKSPFLSIDYLQHNKIFKNGVTDLILVYFDSNNFLEHDQQISSIQDIISTESNGNYISVFTADSSPHSKIKRVFTQQETEDFFGSGSMKNAMFPDDPDAWDDGDFPSFFPIQIFEIILTVIVMLVIAFIGIYCTYSIQTPQRYETPKSKRADHLG